MKKKAHTIELSANEVRLIVDAFGTVSGHWNLEADELALVAKLEALRS